MKHAALALLLSCVVGQRPLPGARLVEVQVRNDGQLVAHTYYEDDGRQSPATVWRYLAEPPIMAGDEGVEAVEPNSATPRIAVLTGDITLSITHAGRTIAQARVQNLSLRRDDESQPAWFLPPVEVERTAASAGLGPPAPTGSGPRLSMLLTLGCFVLLAAAGVAVTMSVQRSRSSASGASRPPHPSD